MRGPIVKVRVTATTEAETIVFTAPAIGQSESFELEAGTLQRARTDVSRQLREFKDDVDTDLSPSAAMTRRALKGLYKRGLVLANVLPSGLGDFDRVRVLFEGAFPDWRDSEQVPLVQLEGPTHGFPFELLPVFDVSRPGAVDDVEGFARRFLGFSAAVWRSPRAGRDTDKVLSGQSLVTRGPLPLSLLWYQPMRGAREEYDFFSDRPEQVEVNGPWPTPELDPEDVLPGLCAVLFDPSRRFDADDTDRELLIQHFACHCDTGMDDPTDYELELSGGTGQSSRVSLGDLNVEWAALQQELGRSDRARPLVFLNACGAGYVDPWRVFSWPEWFLGSGHRGVVGPETLVPDAAAARFAGFFYEALLAERPLGEALVLARRRLLHTYGNPLGLLYMLYADPNIVIRRTNIEEEGNGN